MSEKDLTAQLLLKLRKVPNTWWYKIPDPSRCPSCGTIAIASKRPFDVVGVVNGSAVALELKVSAGVPLKPHQLAQLHLVTLAGGLAFKVEKDEYYMIGPSGEIEHFCKGYKALMKYAMVL